jgi:tRNA/rRNA methyltransferase/tRNA (cytidine32/uridine32-2'-O)-methyltransferase
VGVEANDEPIRIRAVHAGDVWDRVQVFDSLAAALADCSVAIGVTRRRGHRRKELTLTPAQAAAFLRDKPGARLSGSPAALVFGNERTGLEDAELNLCNMASHIPSDEGFPSLNLSHAVQIYAYELYQALSPAAGNAVEGQWVPINRERVDNLAREITDSLKRLGFYRHPGRDEQESFFRDLISRAALTEREAQYLGGIFTKAARLGARSGEKPADTDDNGAAGGLAP